MSTVPDDRRHTPRYPVGTRLFASIDGRTVILRNISRTGVAIDAHGLEIGSVHLLEINLDHQHMTLAIRILDRSGDSLLHAHFVDRDDDIGRLIDRYIHTLD